MASSVTSSSSKPISTEDPSPTDKTNALQTIMKKVIDLLANLEDLSSEDEIHIKRSTSAGLEGLRQEICLGDLNATISQLVDSSLIEDSLLKEIIEWEKELSDLISQNSDTLSVRKIDVGTLTGIKQFTLISTPKTQLRFASDTNRTKMQRIIDLLKTETSLCWTDYTFQSLKTCTSILTNEDATFCGNLGVLFYLCPDNVNALVAAAAHDILSPSEFGIPITELSKSTVRQYVFHQEIYKIVAIFVKYLLKAIDTESATAILAPSSTFYKKYYMDESPQPTVIEQIVSIKSKLKHTSLKNQISADDLDELKERVSIFLESDFFTINGIQRKETTGWELTENATTHIFHPNQRSRCRAILNYPYRNSIPLPSGTTWPGEKETVHVEYMKQLLSKKTQLFRNIILNVTENYTVQEAIDILHKKKRDYENLKTLIPKTDSSSASSSNATSSASSKPHDPVLAEIEYTKEIYTEIQLYSKHLFIRGLGVKKAILTFIQSPTFELVQKHYKEYTDLGIKKNKEQVAIFTKFKTEVEGREELKETASPENFAELECAALTYLIMEAASEKEIPLFLHEGPQKI